MNTVALKRPSYKSTDVLICRTVAETFEGHIALDLLRHLAIAACEPGGENSDGSQALRLLTPEEVAKRACDIAASMYGELITRGWMIEVPLPTYGEVE